jgi:hypothetical protein
MMGPAVLLLGADRIGFTQTTSAAATVALVVLLPLALFILRRRPEVCGSCGCRVTSSVVLIMAATSFRALAATDNLVVTIGASLLFGLTVGNVTTLSPIIVRREFCAAARFLASPPAQSNSSQPLDPADMASSMTHDLSGSYREPLLVVATMDMFAAIVILRGRATKTVRCAECK